MPVCAVRRSACGEGTSSLGQSIAASRVPESDGASIEVDLVCDVVPLVCSQLHTPFRNTSDVPLQLIVALAAVLKLSEMAFEKGNLMFVRGGRGVLGGCLNREVVEEFALVDSSGRLRDKLSPQHGLAIPFGCTVNGNLDTLLRASVGWVLELGVEVDVFVD